MQDDYLQSHLTVLESMEKIVSKFKSCTIKLNIYHQTLVRILTTKIQKYTTNLMSYKYHNFNLLI